MKTIFYLMITIIIPGCAAQQDPMLARAPAQVGIVNHTGNFIYSASVDGDGGGTMGRWGVGLANVCCASIPRVWHPGILVLVQWDMPEGHQHIVKNKKVEVEKYDRTGDIYLHFYPNDEVRVVVSNWAGYGPGHPIPPPVEPIEDNKQR